MSERNEVSDEIELERMQEICKKVSIDLTVAKKKLGFRIHKKYGDELPLHLFLYLDLCAILQAIYKLSPTIEAANSLINFALEDAANDFKGTNT